MQKTTSEGAVRFPFFFFSPMYVFVRICRFRDALAVDTCRIAQLGSDEMNLLFSSDGSFGSSWCCCSALVPTYPQLCRAQLHAESCVKVEADMALAGSLALHPCIMRIIACVPNELRCLPDGFPGVSAGRQPKDAQ